MQKLNYFIKKDSRIRKVYNYAKKKYNGANLAQHNWEHILRDLYRALIIAKTERNIDYSILIPAVLLHDIGVTAGECQKQEEVGTLIVKRDLPRLGYTKDEIEKIALCIKSHHGKIKPKIIEAKILFDADKLEKCGIGGVFSLYRVQQELKIPLDQLIERAETIYSKFFEERFYTEKAKEISGNGFRETLGHFKAVKKSIKRRKDFLISEKDLWNKENQ